MLNVDSDFFSELERHPPINKLSRLHTLELKYLHLSEADMEAIGPCFTNVKNLIWYMNRFDEVAYDNYIEPYFENIHYENDDGYVVISL
jgi:hypothetical protein